MLRRTFCSTLLAGALPIRPPSGLMAGQEKPRTGDELLASAGDRIEKHRKADAVVAVVDAAGRPAQSVRVAIEQTRHEFLFGCNIFMWGRVGNEKDEDAYRSQYCELLNYATLPFYWFAYEPRRGQPGHDRVEPVARWCREKGIITKGHPLAWNWADPVWLPDDGQEVRSLQMARIDDCVGRFKGLIDYWDVVNEAAHFERDELKKRAPKLTGMWERVGRAEFVRECFRHARTANPKATLLINDYRTDEPYAKLIKNLVDEKGERIYNVIGIQSHMHGGPWSNEKIWQVCERFATFGVPLHFTETTIVSGKPGWELAKSGQPWPSTPDDERTQAEHVERFYTMLFSHPAVSAITWWDFSDRGAWQRAPAGLVRADMSPKPAYERLHRLVKDRWWSRTTVQTDPHGEARFRGFLGDYNVAIRVAPDKQVDARLSLAKDSPNRVTVKFPGG